MKTAETPTTTLPESTRAIQTIKETVAQEFGIQVSELEGNVRREPLPMIRHVAMALCYELIEYITLQGIATSFNRSEHQTILHGINATQSRCDISPTFKARVDRVRKAAKLILSKDAK